MKDVLLQAVHLSKSFGGLRALDDVTLTLRRGEARAVIGPNGAGKSTLLHLLSGALLPDRGTIFFKGMPLVGLPPYQIARLGIARTFQISQLFEGLTVADAVRLALARGKLRSLDPETLHRLLEQLGLGLQAHRRARELSHGERRLVELALAVAQRPTLCLLDEPTAGLDPSESERIVHVLLDLKERQHTLLIVEHDMGVVRAVADTVTVLHQGRVWAEGTPDEIRRDARVQKIYELEIEG
ncbi:MAG: ABC transporter ATP-binding protein [Candidatus Bipolaricaulota bacterium]|nr:ABC transporter ATP-binding protein [Candidatus Bipolaricaulota bacterium]MCS7273868.1 ABC transporter ATP-binding protein [Candidatus Bipolaricaulota bacterium]MDW8110714.1 ABC transporter ATP-binding protein [Candidatus Bipolaricaulota bacterium]MDW8328428.1 ABC transporter ATP-binding protein [Candidatus Bipolaricaulota bacterium]